MVDLLVLIFALVNPFKNDYQTSLYLTGGPSRYVRVDLILHHGPHQEDCRQMISVASASVDALVTDVPFGNRNRMVWVPRRFRLLRVILISLGYWRPTGFHKAVCYRIVAMSRKSKLKMDGFLAMCSFCSSIFVFLGERGSGCFLLFPVFVDVMISPFLGYDLIPLAAR